MNLLNAETEDTLPIMLELAANNDLEAFKKHVDQGPSALDRVGLWYGRQKGSNQMVLQHRTPLMVAATYGSIEILKFILSFPEIDVNRASGLDKSTALHCAASGGSVNAVEIVKLLLEAGADPNLTDLAGFRPGQVIVVPPKLQTVKHSLQTMLSTDIPFPEEQNSRISIDTSNLQNSPRSTSPSPRFVEVPVSPAPEKKEYPTDPTLPDIKNGVYSTDEFRMFSFKVRPCSRAYSHDWTECPFVHPGENARRRDPRKYHYSCVPCPDFRKGACRRGDLCEYAHGVFECWLHPAQYRTRPCKDGINCDRRVCFFAHTQEELRPLYVSTGSAVLSPRSSTDLLNNFVPGSPSSVHVMSPSPFTPPISPSINGMGPNGDWTGPQNVPALHLPGSNLQSSRLRSSLNARDIGPPPEEGLSLFNVQQKEQLLNEMSLLSQQSMNNHLLNRSNKTLAPSNLEDIFSAESSSPRFSDQALGASVFSPTHKSALLNQFQHQQPSMLSPIKTSFPSRNVDPISPMSPRFSMLAQREKFRSLSSRDLGSNGFVNPDETWSKWGSPSGPVDWAVNDDGLGKLKRSSSFEVLNNGEEPDLSWVHSLVKETPPDMKEKSVKRVGPTGSSSGEGSTQIEQVDQSVLGAWLEQMQLDQLMAQ